ncbi:hypothetical protein [Kutzneria sp. NPDC052558]
MLTTIALLAAGRESASLSGVFGLVLGVARALLAVVHRPRGLAE